MEISEPNRTMAGKMKGKKPRRATRQKYCTAPVPWDFVVVHWLDHQGPTNREWRWVEDLKDSDMALGNMWTAGWIIKETDSTLVVAPSVTDQKSFNDETIIAKKLIVSVTSLLETKK